MISQSKIEPFIKKWAGAKKSELKNRFKLLKTKPKTSAVIAEITAIKTLLL